MSRPFTLAFLLLAILAVGAAASRRASGVELHVSAARDDAAAVARAPMEAKGAADAARPRPAARTEPSAILCSALLRASLHGAAGLFPWHEAVLVGSEPARPPAESLQPPGVAAAGPGAAAPDPLERGRTLLLAGRPDEAWLELKSAAAEGGDASFLRAWAAAAAGDAAAPALLAPFTEPPTPLACRAPALRAAARGLAAAGDVTGALEALEQLGRTLPEIPDYVLLWSMEAFEAAPARGSAVALDSVEATYGRLRATTPTAAVLRRADLLRARLFERSGEVARAADVLGSLVARAPRDERPALLVGLARLERRLGRAESGRGRLRQVIERHSESEEALALLSPNPVEAGPRLRVSARDSALVLAAHGRADDAARALSPTGDPALLALRAEIRLRSDDYGAAARDFAAALGRGGADALRLELAKSLTRDGRPGAAREIYQAMAREEGTGARTATLTYLTADAFQEEAASSPAAGDSAASWFRRLVERHPGAELAPRALLRLAHLRFARGDWGAAEAAYREHLRRYPRSEDRREARYWLARTLVESGRAAEGRELLTTLLDGDPADYYRLLARRRLGGAPEAAVASLFGASAGLELPASAAAASDSVLPRGGPAEDRLLRARALLVMGEEEAAQREVDEALRLSGRSRGELRRVARWALSQGFAESAFRVATLMLSAGDPELARLAFPPAYAANVALEAREHGVPAALLWSVMRQESRFDHAVRSPAGAVGLLQLMPRTARGEAAAARAASFEVADLTRPEVNLHLGARHLRGLLDRMEGDVPATLAAYNAGAALASRWRRFPESSTPEGYVERIPFRETRGYVKHIVANRAWYEDLYGRD